MPFPLRNIKKNCSRRICRSASNIKYRFHPRNIGKFMKFAPVYSCRWFEVLCMKKDCFHEYILLYFCDWNLLSWSRSFKVWRVTTFFTFYLSPIKPFRTLYLLKWKFQGLTKRSYDFFHIFQLFSWFIIIIGFGMEY